MLMYLQVRNKHKKLEKKSLFIGIMKATAKKSRIQIRNPVYESKDPNPDPVSIKISRTRNTDPKSERLEHKYENTV